MSNSSLDLAPANWITKSKGAISSILVQALANKAKSQKDWLPQRRFLAVIFLSVVLFPCRPNGDINMQSDPVWIEVSIQIYLYLCSLVLTPQMAGCIRVAIHIHIELAPVRLTIKWEIFLIYIGNFYQMTLSSFYVFHRGKLYTFLRIKQYEMACRIYGWVCV